MENGSKFSPPSKRLFIDNLTFVFPEAEQIRKRNKTAITTVYKGITLKELKPLKTIENKGKFSEVQSFIKHPFIVKNSTEDEIVCTTDSGYSCNGIDITKKIILKADKTWALFIAGVEVDFNKFYITDRFDFDEESVQNICDIVSLVKLCQGKKST